MQSLTTLNSFLLQTILLLAAAVLIVPVTKRLGFGSVIGYLFAGLLIGPSGFKLVAETENLGEVSELGVVFLLFIIGLELDPRRLWSWRYAIFGMGSGQIVLVAALASAVSMLAGFSWQAAVLIGLALAMSSTAVSSQFLRERGLLTTAGGAAAFSILLFQDISVVPVLTLVPWLAGSPDKGPQIPAVQILGVLAIVLIVGHLVLGRIYRLVAGANLREVFTALSLLTVFGLAALMHQLGMSMALGSFMGGVLLANSEYRHAIETDIEPFKGLLLGLFFMSVGMSVDLLTVLAKPWTIAALMLGVLFLKIFAHAVLARVSNLNSRQIPLFSILLSQVGEFAFVMFGSASALGLLTPEETAVLIAVTALSMASTPLLILCYDKLIAPKLSNGVNLDAETVMNDHPEVIIAGFGRVGQIIGRLLMANKIRATILDVDPDQIAELRRFGFKVYYGDATRLDLLEAAGAREAKILVVAVDKPEDSLMIVDQAREHFSNLQIVARARNVDHAYKLMDRKVEIWERETFDSSLRLGSEVLRLMGWTADEAQSAGVKFREHNLRSLKNLYDSRSDARRYVSLAKQAREDLEKLMAGESHNLHRSKHEMNAGLD